MNFKKLVPDLCEHALKSGLTGLIPGVSENKAIICSFAECVAVLRKNAEKYEVIALLSL